MDVCHLFWNEIVREYHCYVHSSDTFVSKWLSMCVPFRMELGSHIGWFVSVFIAFWCRHFLHVTKNEKNANDDYLFIQYECHCCFFFVAFRISIFHTICTKIAQMSCLNNSYCVYIHSIECSATYLYICTCT